MTEPVLLVDTVGDARVLKLNRPQLRNAINAELATAIGEQLEAADADPAIRATILSATGPMFCSGSDLKERAAGRSVEPANPDWGYAGIVRHTTRKPIIAAVNGLAHGGGFEIVLACDLVVAADHVRFALPEAARGLIARAGGLVRLAHQLPVRLAHELALTGAVLTAADAARWGLVNAVVPADELMPRALALVEAISASGPLAVESSKRIIAVSAERGQEAGWLVNDAEMAAIAVTEDAQEGSRAFLEKRAPMWTGR